MHPCTELLLTFIYLKDSADTSKATRAVPLADISDGSAL